MNASACSPRLISWAALSLSAALGSCCPCKYNYDAKTAAAAGQAEEQEPEVAGASATAYEWKNAVVLGGGFVTGIIFSPAEKDLVYARTDIGGAYRFDAAKKDWIPLLDWLSAKDSNLMGIESLAADPKDANLVYLAAGTYSQSWADMGAMLRSKDRGNTWERTDLPIKMGGNENGRSNGERLAIDPNLTSTLLFGSRRNGLWRSADSSVTWEQFGDFPAKSDPKGIGITFVLFDAKSGTAGKPTPVVYAGVASTTAPSLYRSPDSGKTWTPVPKQPKGLMPSHAGFDDNGTLYLSYADQPGPNDCTRGAVYKYESKGDVWTDISPKKPAGDDKFGYGGLAVDAAHPGTLMVTTIDRWTHGDEIYRTADGGKKWVPLAPKAERDIAGAKYLFWDHDKPSATGWMGDIDIDPFNSARAMYVTGQGIWMSDDADQALSDKPTHWTFTDRGLEETVVNDLVSPPDGPPLYSSLADICGFRHDHLDQPPEDKMFSNPTFGSGGGMDVAWQKPNLLVRVGSESKGETVAISEDAGKTWKPTPKRPKGWSGSVALSADGTTIVWSPKDAPAMFTGDHGASWTRAEGLPEPGEHADWARVSLQVAADRVNPKKFYAYDAAGGQVLVSSDGGAHFKMTVDTLPSLADYELHQSSIVTVFGQEGDVWITTGKDLYRSTNSGAAFEAINGVDKAVTIGFGKAADGQSYPTIYLFATINDVTGLFRSTDAGNTYSRIDDDQHQYGGVGLVVGDPRIFGRVYAGTHGRGIVYGDPK